MVVKGRESRPLLTSEYIFSAFPFHCICKNSCLHFYLVLKLPDIKRGTNFGDSPPHSRGTTAMNGAGLGVDRPAELTKSDDEYDAYRKRMMLAYRFRPNPLVTCFT